MARALSAPAALLAALLASGPVAAQEVVTADDLETIASLARGHGSAAVMTDEAGRAYVRARIDGRGYAVVPDGCAEDGTGCDSLRLFSFSSDRTAPLDTLNDWNGAVRYARASREPGGAPVLDWWIPVGAGLPTPLLDSCFAVWGVLMARFDAHTGGD